MAYMTNYKIVRLADYKGEPYVRYRLHFQKWFFKWSIIYDLTMFENWTQYTDLWDEMIETQGHIKLSAIKERKIF